MPLAWRPSTWKQPEVGTIWPLATLSVVDGIVYLEDAGSRNGTFLNSHRVTAKTVLKAGDRVRFDTEEFEFRVDGEGGGLGDGGDAPAFSMETGDDG